MHTKRSTYTFKSIFMYTHAQHIHSISLSGFLFSMFSHSHIPADLVLANVYHPFLNQQAQM
uniref:Uncharacterized protein n=1 Tax=Anguilla anguilla TaxID=7936 RepID=A0A0E9R959_ANGAN